MFPLIKSTIAPRDRILYNDTKKEIAMKKEYVMGNGAIALGALAAGINRVSGYPGTPS